MKSFWSTNINKIKALAKQNLERDGINLKHELNSSTSKPLLSEQKADTTSAYAYIQPPSNIDDVADSKEDSGVYNINHQAHIIIEEQAALYQISRSGVTMIKKYVYADNSRIERVLTDGGFIGTIIEEQGIL